MKTIFTLLLFFHWIFAFGQKEKIPVTFDASKPYDTVYLKKDFRLIFSTTDELRILRLIGPAVDTIISTKNIKASEKYLGWLQTDFDDYFVLYIGYDEQWPSVRVFKKNTGKIILQGISLGIDTIKEIVFYNDPDHQQIMGLFDADKEKIESYNFPKTHCLWWHQCMVSKSITDKELTVEFIGLNNGKEKIVFAR